MSSCVQCELCRVKLSSEVLLVAHNEGKKHQKKVSEHLAFSNLANRSVFISGVSKNTFISKEQVVELVKRFGIVQRVLLDIGKGTYAIVEFEEQQAARDAIQEGRINVDGQWALVKERKMDFDKSEKRFDKESIDVGTVIERMSTRNTSYEDQTNELVSCFCLSQQQLEEREGFAQTLTKALSEYFSSNVEVCIFGSSITSVGTVDSDIDASVIFGEECLVKSDRANPFARNKFTLMTCDVATLRARAVCADEMARLTPADRVRFLCKVLNDIRRRGTAPINDQCPVLDARCPLVRFVFNRKHTFDLSVDNRLGIAKSAWLQHLIAADPSGNLRRFLVAIRFWALANDLMRKDQKTRSHFNAYIVNMLCIGFLQAQSLLPPLQRAPQAISVDGWDIDFVVPPADFSHLRINNLIKNFFVWFIQLKLRDNVLCPRLGVMLTKEEFSVAFPQEAVKESFKFATLNVQDPLELSHNVAQLVSEKYLTSMRREMMLTVSRIKERPNCFVSALRQQSLASSQCSDLDMRLPCGTKSAVECMWVLERILVELLYCNPVDEPNRKRGRMDEGDSASSRCFDLAQRTWVGRRAKKRIVNTNNPTFNEWQTEAEISKAIGQESAPSETPLRFSVHTAVEGGVAEVRVQPVTGNSLDVHNLSHFLSLFLPKHFNALTNNSTPVPMEE